MATSPFANMRRDDYLLAAFSVAAAAGMIGCGVWWTSCQTLWLVNGLPAPVTVELDGSRTDLPPDARVSRTVRSVARVARVLGPGGAVLDEGAFDVPSSGFVAYNPLGAAPLLSAAIHYGSSSNRAQDPEITFYGGQRSAVRQGVDFVFTDPPQTIQVEHGSSTTRVAVMVPKGGFRATMGYLGQHGEAARAAEIARAASRALPDDGGLLGEALYQTSLVYGTDAALAFVREALARRPDDFDAHREYQYLMRRAGRLDEARAEYRARHDRDPGSIDAALLLARVVPVAEGRALLDGVLSAHPDSQITALSAGYLAFAAGDPAAAVPLFARGQAHARYPRFVSDHLQALVALHRTPEAVALAARFLGTEGDERAPVALLYNQLARLPDAGPLPAPPLSFVEKLAEKPGSEGLIPLALSVVGEPRPGVLDKVEDKDLVSVVRIQLAAGADPTEAWRLCAAASPAVLDRLFPAVSVLLAAELERAGDHDLAERLLWSRLELPLPRAALYDYLHTGAEHPELWRLEPEWRAALDLARARALEAAGQSGAALYAAVEREDLLQGVVTRARRTWPSLVKAPAAKGAGARPKR